MILVLVLLAAFLVSRSCGKTEARVNQDQAIAIAKQEISFEANKVVIRLQKRGLKQREYWLVGLGIIRSDGSYERATSVLIDADTGAVNDVEEVTGGS